MKKIISVISITVLFVLLSGINIVNASTQITITNVGYYITYSNGYYFSNIIWYDLQSTNNNKIQYGVSSAGVEWLNSLEAAISGTSQKISEQFANYYNTTQYASDAGIGFSNPSNVVYIYNLPKLNANIDPVEPTPTPTPTPTPGPEWYEEMWDTLKEELGDPAFWFGEWFIDLIDNVYGNDEEEDPTGPPKPPNSTHVKINNPTPAPTPTPIPYSTVIVPKTDIISGDTVYETNYYYVNPSGTPIVATAPPTQPPASGGNGNGTDYTPVGGDPYAIPQVSWLTNGVLTDDNNNTMDGISSIADGMDSIDAIGTDYTDGMGVVQDATGTLPTSWLLLIGIAAAIPLIAGIISRFLS